MGKVVMATGKEVRVAEFIAGFRLFLSVAIGWEEERKDNSTLSPFALLGWTKTFHKMYLQGDCHCCNTDVLLVCGCFY